MATKPFNEQFKSKHVAPDCGNDGATEFPMDEVISRLDGEQPGDSETTMDKTDLVKALREMFLWMTKAKAQDQRAVKAIGIRVIAAAWVINPEIFGNAPAHMVAKSFGIAHQSLKTKTADFSRVFKIQNRYQVHDWQNKRH